MKPLKILFFISLFISLFTSDLLSQNETVNLRVKEKQPYAKYTGVTADTIGKTDSIWSAVIGVTAIQKTTPYIYVDLSGVRGSADTVYVYLKAKEFTTEKFVTLDTLIWVNSSSNSATFNLGTAYLYEQYQIYILGQTDEYAVKVNAIYCKFSYSD